MTQIPGPDPRVGRILTSEERAARMVDETVFAVPDEELRSAFAISAQHVLTAWHCVRDTAPGQSPLWFRLRSDAASIRSYIYIPIRLANYDEAFDVAALAIDGPRLNEAHLSAAQATGLLAQIAILLGFDVRDNDQVQVMGFPESASSADSDTNSATVVHTRLPLGDVAGLKLLCPALGTASPMNPHGLSGAPVLRASQVGNEILPVAVAVVRAVPAGSIPGIAPGGSLIATRIEDIAERLPEVNVAVQAARRHAAGPQPRAVHGHGNALAMSNSCLEKLRDSVVEVEDPDLGILVGWPHFFNEPLRHRRPTAIGTAYGLKLALVLGGQDYRPDRSRLAETLWKLRRPDGGWAARTGTGLGRPEVSALVLGALSSSGFDAAHLAEAGYSLEQACSPGLDPEGLERTYVVGAVMRGLIRSLPRSPRLEELRAILLAGAITDPARDGLLCWSNLLRTDDGETLTPSSPHTAQAIVALLRAGNILGEDARARAAIDQAVQRLRTARELGNRTEQIRRFVKDGQPWESRTVRHFTAAWIARALLLLPPADLGGTDILLDAAVRRVWQAHHDGLWEWDDGDRPLWMSYQGASVVRDYALHTSMTLP